MAAQLDTQVVRSRRRASKSRAHIEPEPKFMPPETEPPRTPRIVLAEDDAELRRLLATKLRKRGYEVVDMGTGERLAQYLIVEGRLADTDLIVSDIRMPGLSGMDMLAYLGIRGEFPPVVLITGFGDWRVHEEAMKLGALTVFDKPLDLDDLVTWITDAIPPGGASDKSAA
jgi:DNA-binding NtrC family response regulator